MGLKYLQEFVYQTYLNRLVSHLKVHMKLKREVISQKHNFVRLENVELQASAFALMGPKIAGLPARIHN